MPGVACFCRVAENHWWSRVVRASRRSWLLTDVTFSYTAPLGCGVSVRAFAVILHSFRARPALVRLLLDLVEPS